jgi:hypothetical protein
MGIVRRFHETITLLGQMICLVGTVTGAPFIVTLNIPYHIAYRDPEAKSELHKQNRSLQSTRLLSLNQAG